MRARDVYRLCVNADLSFRSVRRGGEKEEGPPSLYLGLFTEGPASRERGDTQGRMLARSRGLERSGGGAFVGKSFGEPYF